MFDEDDTSSSFAYISSRRSGTTAEKVSTLLRHSSARAERDVSNAPVYSAPTQVVVFIIAAVRGKSTAYSNKLINTYRVKKTVSV